MLWSRIKLPFLKINNKIQVNLYADEVQMIKCPYTRDKWIYIGLIAERLDNPLLDEIIKLRYINNFDKSSSYYKKNDRIIHWSDIDDAETMHIAQRWIEFIMKPENADKFYFYVLGINISKLDIGNFNKDDFFRSVYNRFFRSAILYLLKTAFPNNYIVVKDIFHEEGHQREHKYFPWHPILSIKEKEENIEFSCTQIKFLPKSHREDEEGDKRSNIIQLCDLLLGLCVGALHGINKSSKRSKYRKPLIEMFLPFLQSMMDEPQKYKGRIMIRFFPKEKITPNRLDNKDYNLFFTKRKIYYLEDFVK